jgi:dTDP-4-dehydrorhamnose 3,5-epimerase
MDYKETAIKGVYIIEPRIFNDDRGYFFEAWKQAEFEKHIGKVSFVQDNESKSCRGVLRGLHYQRGETSQAKLVRVIKGCVVDVAVDLRRSSPTFGQHVMVELSEENKRQLYIPRGFAHGFLVLSEEAIFTYKVDNPYAPQSDAGIRWNDPTLAIEWPTEGLEVLTSEKDLIQPLFKDAELFD